MIELISLRPHRYGGKQYQIGDSFQANPLHVHMLTFIGRAKKPDDTAKVATAPKAKRTYRRRDMRAA